MSQRARLLLVVGIWAGLACACGSDEPAPPLTPTLPELPSTAELPTETPTIDPELHADPNTDVVDVVEVVAPSEGPVTPVISGEATLAPPMPDLDELEHVSATFEISRGTTRYDEVAYSVAVQGALLRQLRATMRDLLDGFVPTAESDDEWGSYYDASCVANLALPEMVAYTCVRTITEGRGLMETVVATKLFAIAGDNVRALDTDDFLIPGTDFDELAERYGADADGPMTLTYSGVGFVDAEGEVREIPYVDLGALIDPTSAAGRVPGVTAIAAVTTQLALDAAPPASIAVLTLARPLPSAALFAANQGLYWIFSDVRGASVAAATPMVIAATGTLSAGTTTVDRAWSTPLRVLRTHLHRAAQLRPAPRRPAEGPMLPGGTVLYAVLGETGAGASRTGGGQWTLVAVSETRMGWLPSALVRDSEGPLPGPSVEAFLASLPEAERAAVRPTCSAIEYDRGYVLTGQRGGNTVIGLVPNPGYREVPATRLLLTHPGTLLAAQVAGAQTAVDTRSLAILTWAIEGDDAHVRVEVFAAPESGLDAGAPVLTLTLASSSAAARERQSVAVGVTRHGHYTPLVVRGPGRAETLYARNGTTLAVATE